MSATHDNTAHTEREEIEGLLPWYVAGKLEPHLTARVRQYLEANPELAHQVAIAREESDAAIAANEAIRPLGAPALERLRASVAAHPRKPSIAMRLSSWRDTLAEAMSALSPSQIALASFAAALLILVQAGVIGTLMVERARAPIYETASGPQDAKTSIELLVGFRPTATVEKIDALLRQMDAHIVDGPRSGLYKLRIPATDVEDGGRADALRALQQSGIIGVALPGK